MRHFNMADFLRGQASRILTSVSKTDDTGFVCKHGKPIVVVMSNERYERLLRILRRGARAGQYSS